MSKDDPKLAVRRFVRYARQLAGSGPRLADAIAPILGSRPESETVNGWAQGARLAPADALFAMKRAYPDLSLDEFAMGEGERASLQAQIDELNDRLGRLQAALDQRFGDMGQEPLEVPTGA